MEDLIEQVRIIAISAGDKIMEIYSDEASFGVETKADNSPLTRADREANEVICKGLEKLKIVYPILSEENKEIEYVDRKHYDYFWMVDPLDGTKEFIKRNGEFTVNIALIHKERSVAGVVYVPVTKEMYWAIDGEGAFYQKDNQHSQLKASKYQITDAGLKVVCSRSHLNDETSSFLDNLNEPETVAKGSSLKFLILAEGKAQIYPRLAPTMEWDTAAAQIILEEAGGKVLRADDHKPLSYNKENLTNPKFIAHGSLT